MSVEALSLIVVIVIVCIPVPIILIDLYFVVFHKLHSMFSVFAPSERVTGLIYLVGKKARNDEVKK